MATPDGWLVELVRFDAEPRFRVRCAEAGEAQRGVLVTLDELVAVLGESFELLDAA